MDSVPPKTLKNQLVRLDNNLKQIERKQFAGIQRAPGSLPVLEAFQEYLDNERRIAKRRMIALTATFALILVAVGAGAGLTVYLVMQRMAVDYDEVASQTKALEASVASQQATTQSSLAALEQQLSETKQTSESLRSELLSAHTNVVQIVESDSARMTEFQEVLDRLAGENKALKEDLDRVMANWPSVTHQVAELTSNPTGQPRHLAAISEDSEKRTPTAAMAIPPLDQMATIEGDILPESIRPALPQNDPSVIALTLVPSGEQHGIRWRLPATLE